MNFVENFNALFDQSFFVFLDTKLFEQAVPRGAHAVLTAMCLYLPKVALHDNRIWLRPTGCVCCCMRFFCFVL